MNQAFTLRPALSMPLLIAASDDRAQLRLYFYDCRPGEINFNEVKRTII